MVEFMRDLTFEKSAGSRRLKFSKLQQILLDLMEPVSKVSFTVEKASNSRFEQLEVSLPDFDKFWGRM